MIPPAAAEVIVGVAAAAVSIAVPFAVARAKMDKLFVNKTYSAFTPKERRYYLWFMLCMLAGMAVSLAAAYMFGLLAGISFALTGSLVGLFVPLSPAHVLRIDMDKADWWR